MTTPQPPVARTCTKCDVEKPMDDFTIRLRDTDGTPRKWYAQCRRCRTARITSSRREDTIVRRDYVPVEPFCKWIESKKAERQMGIDALARACGKKDGRQLRRVLRESRSVSIYVVDEWLTGEGSTRLDDLYPVGDPERRAA